MDKESITPELPSGTVTFLFTDIEGSTELLGKLGEAYATLLADQREILRECFTKWSGREVDTQGDAFFYSFPRATEAVSAAVEAQRAIASHTWPEEAEVRVRMGLHTGEPLEVSEEGYVGMDVHRAARIAHVGHGGQVLLSETTASLVLDKMPEGVSLVDLGRHLLKDIHRPERVRQLVIEGLRDEFPPLISLEKIPTAEMREPRSVGQCPYRGLSAFRMEDAPFFYGREAFTERLREAISTKQIVAVIVGSSGSGKSSAVFAGLLPQMSEDESWRVVNFRPRSQPFYSMAGALLPHLEPELSETDRLAETRNLADRLKKGEIALIQAMERILEKSAGSRQLLMVIDQFEELYTLCADVEVQRGFIDGLLAAVEAGEAQRVSPIVIVLTLRADFMGQALTHRPFADALQEASLIIGPMTREELRMAIEKPAELQGAAIEPGLVERILDDVGEEPGNLPLLEFALTLLWERQSDGWLTHDNYEAIGCVDGALASYADEVYRELDESEREGARRIFVQLVQPGEGTEDTRRVGTYEELGEENRELVQHLADKRLIVTGRDASSGQEIVEVVHEALIQHWRELQVWMEADRSFRAWQERLRSAIRAWEESGRDDGALLRGAPLVQSEEWLIKRGEDLSGLEREFVRESATHREKRQTIRERRRTRTIIGLATGLVIALILAVFAGQQWRRAEEASSVAIAERSTAQAASTQAINAGATAQSNANAYATASALVEREVRIERAFNLIDAVQEGEIVDPELGMLLALNAISLTRELDGSVLPEAWSLLHQTARMHRNHVLDFQIGDANLIDSMMSPDGGYLVTYENPLFSGRFGPDGVTRIWEIGTGEELGTVEGHLVADSWTENSQLATFEIVDRRNMHLSFWDVPSLQVNSEIYLDLGRETELVSRGLYGTSDVYTGIEYVALSPDGEKIGITFAGKSTVHLGIWDLDSGKLDFGEENVALIHPGTDTRDYFGENIRSVFSPDGKYLMIGTIKGEFNVWDMSRVGIHFQAIQGSEDWVVGMDFSPDGKFLATGGGVPRDIDPTAARFPVVKIWDVQSGLELAQLRGHEGYVNDISCSPDAKLIATASEDGTVRIWDARATLDTREGHLLFTITDIPGQVRGVTFSPFGTELLIYTMEGLVSVWSVSSSEDYVIPLRGVEDLFEGEQSVSLSLNPDGTRMAMATGSRSAYIWDTKASKILMELHDHQDSLDSVSYSPAADVIATTSDVGTVKLWEGSSGEPIMLFESDDKGFCDLDFHPDGDQFAVTTISGMTWLLDIDQADEGLARDTEPKSIEQEGLFLSRSQTIGGEALIVGCEYVEYTRDGGRIALNDDRQVLFKDTTTGYGTGDIVSLYFSDMTRDHTISNFVLSPDGERLVTASHDGPIVLWDIDNREAIRTYIGHASPITQIAFDPTGEHIAAGTVDGEIYIWNVESGDEIFRLNDHSDEITGLLFSSDTKYLYSGGADGMARRYLMDLDDLIELAKSRVTRDLTPAECQEYLHMAECPPLP